MPTAARRCSPVATPGPSGSRRGRRTGHRSRQSRRASPRRRSSSSTSRTRTPSRRPPRARSSGARRSPVLPVVDARRQGRVVPGERRGIPEAVARAGRRQRAARRQRTRGGRPRRQPVLLRLDRRGPSVRPHRDRRRRVPRRDRPRWRRDREGASHAGRVPVGGRQRRREVHRVRAGRRERQGRRRGHDPERRRRALDAGVRPERGRLQPGR